MEQKQQDYDIKLAAFDLDGTLLNNKKEISNENLAAIENALDRGIYIVPATGRTNRGIPIELKDNKRIRYGICSNGAAVVDLKSLEVIHKQYISFEKTKELLEVLSQEDLIIDILSKGMIITEANNFKKLDQFLIPKNMRTYIASTRTKVEQLNEYITNHPNQIEKVNIFFKSLAQRLKVIDMLQGVSEIGLTSSIPNNLEINDEEANKGAALVWLAEHLGIAMHQVMACGDGENDYEMIEVAGLSVAMANGLDELKNMADVVALTNEEHGVANVLKNYVL